MVWISKLACLLVDYERPGVEIYEKEGVINIQYNGGSELLFLGLAEGVAYLGSGLVEIIKAVNSTFNGLELITQLSVADEICGYASIFERIHVLPPRTHAVVLGQSYALSAFFQPQKITASSNIHTFPELLIEEIKLISDCNRPMTNFAIRFSGGVDSSAILLSACEMLKKESITCLTWTSGSGEIDEDVYQAQRKAREQGVSICPIVIRPADIFCLPSINSISPNISTSTAFVGVLQRESDLLREIFNGQDVVVLDGHGGDHLFLDPVPLSILQNIRLEKGLIAAMRAAINYSRFYGDSFWQTFSAVHKPNKLSLPVNPFLSVHAASLGAKNDCTFDTSEVRRLAAIKDAIFQCGNPARKSPAFKTYFPLVSDAMVAKSLQFYCSEMFDGQSTRKPFRTSVTKHYGKNAENRPDKGHLTGAYQRALKEKFSDLLEMVRVGVLNSAGLLNMTTFEAGMEKVASGFGGIPIHLLKILCLELNVCGLKKHMKTYI